MSGPASCDAVRAEVRRGLDWQQTADCVARALRASLPDPAAILPASLRRGDPAGYQSHLLYVEPDGTFSISAMVWLPGQQTMIHDHVAWCVTGVLQGREYEEIFALADGGRALRLAARNVNPAGTVNGFAPPATSTASATPVTPWPSPCTSTARTSPASATASAASTPSRSTRNATGLPAGRPSPSWAATARVRAVAAHDNFTRAGQTWSGHAPRTVRRKRS